MSEVPRDEIIWLEIIYHKPIKSSVSGPYINTISDQHLIRDRLYVVCDLDNVPHSAMDKEWKPGQENGLDGLQSLRVHRVDKSWLFTVRVTVEDARNFPSIVEVLRTTTEEANIQVYTVNAMYYWPAWNVKLEEPLEDWVSDMLYPDGVQLIDPAGRTTFDTKERAMSLLKQYMGYQCV